MKYKHKVSPEKQAIIEETAKLYQEGWPVSKLAKKFSCRCQTITRRLSSVGIEHIPTPKSEIYKKFLGFTVNTEVMNTSNEMSNTFLGWMITDGNFRPDNLNKISLALKQTDSDILKKFHSWLGLKEDHGLRDSSNYDVRTEKTYYRTTLSFSSKEIHTKLYELGIRPQKSTKEVLPPEEWQTRHLFRAIVEGDGFVADPEKPSNTYPKLGLVGSKEICQGLLDFVKRNGVETKARVTLKEKKVGLYQISFGGLPSVKVMKLLYSDYTIALPRKEKNALYWIKKYDM